MSKHLVEIDENDLKFFIELLSYHESEILKQLEACENETMKDILKKEQCRCIESGERLLKLKSFKV